MPGTGQSLGSMELPPPGPNTIWVGWIVQLIDWRWRQYNHNHFFSVPILENNMIDGG